MVDKKRSAISHLCESLGKLCLVSVFAYSAFVITTAISSKEKNEDYQERLRKAYAGLSPEEY